jgi:hypothetical protein
MSSYPKDAKAGLPTPTLSTHKGGRKSLSITAGIALLALALASATLVLTSSGIARAQKTAKNDIEPHFASKSTHEEVCGGVDGRGVSHSGYIGLKGDSEENPKRSFYWCVLIHSVFVLG